uniref:Uncharacterized protein n=1 Tax=Meloidogyne floridensis TaxID=298350 RepID=A0A915NHP8_9BILA
LSIPRSYYSRPNRDDKDYFDFDLQHSVDIPQHWETKLLNEYKAKGEAPLSGYMFTKGPSDYRAAGTSYLSAALRTPSFWEHRFAQIGASVREADPWIKAIEKAYPVLYCSEIIYGKYTVVIELQQYSEGNFYTDKGQ